MNQNLEIKKNVYYVQFYKNSNLSFGILDMSKEFEMLNIGLLTITNEFYSELKNNHSSKFILSFRAELFENSNCFYCFDGSTKSYFKMLPFSPEYVNNSNFLFHKKIVKQHDKIVRVLDTDNDRFDKFYNKNENGFDLCITLK